MLNARHDCNHHKRGREESAAPVEGVRDALAKAPGIRIAEVYYIKEDSYATENLAGRAAIRTRAWVSVGGWRVQAQCARSSQSGQTTGISFDTESGARSMRDGKVKGCSAEVFRVGSESVKLLHCIRLAAGGISP